MFKLGVTGSIGAGKSAAARRLAVLGAEVSNSDELAKSILFEDAEIQRQLLRRFGTKILDENGNLSRENLAAAAFQDKTGQDFLNELLHPRVRQATRDLMMNAEKAGVKLFVVDAPLIFETGLDRELDAVLVVTAPRELRKIRVRHRSGISSADFMARNALQWPQAHKEARADYVVKNASTEEALIQQVDAVFRQLPI
ncbi:MAG: dephospho-CoA kinase [Lentisphaeria bacterium]|nr:dephospho-CoA kinase [Candidatus Neomarinimicrobiota bacterium]MCF7841647.1 dephospho-CoA kinase [Lentisphaeria bacterium]